MRFFPCSRRSSVRFLLGAAFSCSLFFASTPTSYAQTADGQTPAEESVCDGLSGALWGLCVSYCEAMDCDYSFPHADDQACDKVLGNYLKKSGSELPPCEAMPPEEEECTTDCGGTPE